MSRRPTKAELEQRLHELEQEYAEVKGAVSERGERYRVIFENTGNASIIIGQDSIILIANSNFEKLSGYSRQEMEGRMSWTAFIADEDLERMKLYHAMRKEDPASAPGSYEFLFKTRSGDIRNIFLNVGTAPGTGEIIASCMDITERKQAEEALRASEEQYRGILDSIDEAYVELDLKGDITFANKAICRMLGYEHDEIIGLNYRRYTSPETAKYMSSVFNRIYRTGEPEFLMDYEVIRRDGEARTHEMNAAPLRDASGKIAGFRVVARDVTGQKKSIEALRLSEEKYRGILANMEESYFEYDLKGNFTFFNDAAVRMSGYSAEELLGLNFREYCPPETLKRLVEVFQRVYRTGKPELVTEYKVIAKDKTVLVHESTISLMRDASGRKVGFRSLVRNVTPRKQAEEELRRSEERYRGILDNMEEAYYEVDLTGNFTFFNSRAVNRLGYTVEELSGMNYRQYMDEENARKVFNAYHRVFLTGEPITGVDWELRDKQGGSIFVEASVSLRRDAQGNPTGFRGVVRDITQRKRAEEALRRSEAMYRFLTEKMNDIVWTLDLDLHTTYVSHSIAKVLGFTPEERMAQNPKDQMTAESLAETGRIMAFELERDGKPGVDPDRTIIMETEYYHKDGSRIWLESMVSAIRAENGGIIGLHGVSRDINERKKAEEALRRSEEKYRTILESMDEAYFELDLKGNYTFVNESQCRFMGYTRDELVGMNYRSYVSPETAARAYQVFNEIYHTGEKKTLLDYEVSCKDGRKIMVEMSASLVRGHSGEPIGFRGVGRDVTDRILAEKALRESERKYRLLAENLQDVIWVLDTNLKYVYVSPSVMQLRGYTPEEAMQQTLDQILTPESYRKAMDAFAQESNSVRNGHTHGREWARTLELELLRKDGSTVWTDVTVSILYDGEGRPEGLLGISRDITDRKQAEMQLRESEERWQFALEGAGDGVWDYDIENDRVYRSRRWKEMLGYGEGDIDESPRAGVNLIHPEDREKSDAILDRHLRGEIPVYISEHRVRCKDGTYKWILDRGKVIRWSEGGRPLRIIGTQTDITERKQAEESLKLSEERYRSLFDGMLDGVYRSTHEGRFMDINSAMVEMFGYSSKEEMLQIDVAKELYFTPEDRGSHLIDSGHQETDVYRMRRRDGSEIWVEDHGRYIHDEQGSILIHEGTLRDVTERVRAEETIRKSEERYRTIFENTATANIIVAEDTTILLANGNFEQLTGYTRQELEGKIRWTDFVVTEELERMIEYHRARRSEPGSAPSVYEFKARIRSGEVRNLFMSVSMIPDTRESVASIIDMTERKYAEDALKQSEERFRDLASLLPETVFETDEKGRFTFVNQISLERFGYTREEVDRGMNVLDVIAPEDHEKTIANYWKSMEGAPLGLKEYTALRKDGSTFPVLIHTTAIYREGKAVGLRGFLIDVTEKKTLEQQLMRAQKLEAIGTLAGGIAHDFNNLLMGILGNVSLMLMHFEEAHPFHDRLKSMEEYVQRGSDLTKQLLGFARGGKYEVKATDLGEFTRRSAEMFGRTKREIRIHHKAPRDLWSVEVDRGQMEQVLLNLFVNAWQAMPGGGDLYLSVENVELSDEEVNPYGIDPGRFVKLTVTDTGVGMDEVTRARIFEPFFSTKERGRGTGLGLASVYGIVKNHGGFILVESEKDIGTSFMVYLPISDKEIVYETQESDKVHKGRETVLLVDDEEMIVEVGAQMLEALGYKVLSANGGRQGLQIFDQHKGDIDLVILDMIMPDLGGKETFEALRRQNSTVKVLLSSGYSLDGQAKEIMARGCKGFIQKPFTMAELSKRIRDILEEH